MKIFFVEKMLENGGITPLQHRLLTALTAFEKNIDVNGICLFTLLLAKQNDGDTRIPIQIDLLKKTLIQKLLHLNIAYEESFFTSILDGVQSLKNGNFSSIVETKPQEDSFFKKPFCLFEGYLYPSKYFFSKLIVERKVKELLVNKPFCETDVKGLIDGISAFTRDRNGNGIVLEKEQAQAIIRGREENLIITGGPGTGKTTVIFFLLRELYLNNRDYLLAPLYLAAPSGKAADRMKESIQNSLNLITADEFEGNLQVYEKIANSESFTIHRLLGYNASENKFVHSKDNPFPRNSVFVIDESSMIDLPLFASLLQAIPADARIFLLGDPNQLPSIDAGAVLGNLLETKDDSTVKLTVSRRFNSKSEIGRFAQLNENDNVKFLPISNWDPQKEVQLLENTSDSPATSFKSFLEKWFEKYLHVFTELTPQLDPYNPNQRELREKIWNLSIESKILAAEKTGVTGVNNINTIIENLISQRSPSDRICKIVMLNQNQKGYKLYNGDIGIYCEGKNGEEFIMFKKNDEFQFFPAYQFARNTLDSAFAMTIHKSQGSEYNHVLMLLPSRIGHPLLNRQILYTGITRAKESVTIVATPETFKAACETITERDTGISL